MKDLFKYWILKIFGKENYKKIILFWWTIKNFLNRYFLFIEPELSLLSNFIKPGDCVIDIGLNMGQYTNLMQKSVGENGKVIGFEPDPLSFKYAQKLVTNPNTTIYNFGLSDENRIKKFAIFYDKFNIEILGLTAVVEDEKEFRKHLTHKVQMINIDCKKMDDFLINEKGKITFIKCDVQGHESQVIKGGINIIEKNKPILLIEITVEKSFKRLMNLLSPLGYGVYKYINGSLMKLESRTSSLILSNNNYIFINSDALNELIDHSGGKIKIEK